MNLVVVLLALPAVFSSETTRIVTPPGEKEGTGRVEVQFMGQWGTICDKGWDKKDAQVVCQENGYLKAIHEARRAKYGQGKGKIWLKNVNCKGTEMMLHSCDIGTWGDVWGCDHSHDVGVKCLHDAVPQILEVGCFTDVVTQRALPDLYANNRLKVDWFNLRSMVTKCAEGAHARDYKYFGIQFYGECFGSHNGSLTFDKYKKGSMCMEGVGMHSHNFVYRFAPWKDLGCWKDEPGKERAMVYFRNFRLSIDWFIPVKTVEKCYEAAKKNGYKYFAIQFYGECWVSQTDTFKRYGQSTECWSGLGKHWTNYVYEVKW